MMQPKQWICGVFLFNLLSNTLAFQPVDLSCHSRTSKLSALAMNTPKPSETAEFEYQELKANLEEMQKQNIKSIRLTPEKRQELARYASKIVNRRPTSMPMTEMGKQLPDSKWKLVFTTQAVNADLPGDATIVLDFKTADKVDYCLEFSKKTLGLNRIVAKSSYSVDPGPANPGVMTLVYDAITTDLLGLQNLGIGFFGMLKGRSNYIRTAYFDGKIWVDRGFDQMNDGLEYFNVYVLQSDKEEGDWSD